MEVLKTLPEIFEEFDDQRRQSFISAYETKKKGIPFVGTFCIYTPNEIIMAYKDEKFFRCQNGGVMSIPDGGPLKTYGQKKGYTNMERITGPDIMLELFKVSEEKKLRR